MEMRRFDGNNNQKTECEYIKWLNEYPDGFILNFRKDTEGKGSKSTERFARLHSASCKRLCSRQTAKSQTPFTGGMYAKLVSNSFEELDNEGRRILGLDSIKKCPCLA
ncbi:hypothetical protein [Morganella morganii]|uniref:hypothetical protein n=1 Tax=Morganella morganii TaxID=582 RepID=UPI002796289A|nr:hypothetical protein [Morganella morganii]WLV38611.1 hypothetical protein M2O45_16295 [Morganella morganii]